MKRYTIHFLYPDNVQPVTLDAEKHVPTVITGGLVSSWGRDSELPALKLYVGTDEVAMFVGWSYFTVEDAPLDDELDSAGEDAEEWLRKGRDE